MILLLLLQLLSQLFFFQMTENFFAFFVEKKKQSKNPQQIESKYFSIVFCGCFWVRVLCKVLFWGFSSAFWILSTFKDIYY